MTAELEFIYATQPLIKVNIYAKLFEDHPPLSILKLPLGQEIHKGQLLCK